MKPVRFSPSIRFASPGKRWYNRRCIPANIFKILLAEKETL
jgi:hypothetical protein